MYDFLLAVHVLAAVLWVGGGVSIHVLVRRAQKSQDARYALTLSREASAIGNRLYAPLSLILVIAGSFLVNEAGYGFSQLWITLGYAAWLVSFVLGIGFYSRQQKRIDEAAEREGADGPGVSAGIRRVLAVNSFEILILVLAVVDMAIKPGT